MMRVPVGRKSFQILAIVAVFAGYAYAKMTGPDRGYTGAPGDIGDCTVCHDSFGFPNVGPGSVSIGNVPPVYQPGQLYTLTVNIQDPHARRWGFEMTALDSSGNKAGAFAPLDSYTQIASTGTPVGNRQYIEHTLEGTFPGTSGGHTWQVQWAAPATDIGTVKFYCAGNAANNDGTNQGDYIYTNGAQADSPTSHISLTLDSDPGGTTLAPGSQYSIMWSATNLSNVESYEVRYSTDNGATFPITNLIFSTTDSDVTTATWNVPDISTSTARIRVLAATMSGSAVTVMSGKFSISGTGTGPAPAILSASITGKMLLLTGENFQAGAKVLLNGVQQKTKSGTDMATDLICKKAGKQIAAGQTVTLVVINPDGSTSADFIYTRPSQ